jgi:hypothetical protein
VNGKLTALVGRALVGPVMAAALSALLLAADFTSSSPKLHACLHDGHEPSPSHDCLACALGHGLGHAPDAPHSVTPSGRPAFVAAASREAFFTVRDFTLQPERGPPVLS